MTTCTNPLYKQYIDPLLPPPTIYSLYSFCPSVTTVASVFPQHGSPYANPVLNPPSAFPPAYATGNAYPNGIPYGYDNRCSDCCK
jgi:hypothetical protein